MTLPPCILTLLIVYLVLLGAGIWFFCYLQKTRPHPLPQTDIRYRFVRRWRFAVFVLLGPPGVTGGLAMLGWLDPLFFLIRDTF